jgi:hypothetical protein
MGLMTNRIEVESPLKSDYSPSFYSMQFNVSLKLKLFSVIRVFITQNGLVKIDVIEPAQNVIKIPLLFFIFFFSSSYQKKYIPYDNTFPINYEETPL